jgi:acyl-coenzyme A thioesterase PaaI-like protein
VTIGIAVRGPGAGLAAFRALAAVEKIGRGAIGGFVSFVAITAGGKLIRAETQRGGTTTLFTDGEATGVEPPPETASAPLAGLMSSGPDRPAPLSQFTPAATDVGLVTGHRLPNMPGKDGVALNQAVLASMQAGEPAARAARTILEQNPEADAGFIALGLEGEIFVGNTAHTAHRGDLGRALISDASTGTAVAVLHNAIHPYQALADFAASVALDSMNPKDRVDFTIEIAAGTPIELGDANAVAIDDGGHAVTITVTQSSWLGPSRDGAVIDFEARVQRDGRSIGYTITEPYCVVRDGRLISLSGRKQVTIGVRAIDGPAKT